MSAVASEPTIHRWLVDEVLQPAYRNIVPDRNVWQWADDGNVYLDSKAARTPGWYDSARTPHVREFMETFTDPAWREDLAIKSSRSGYTEAALNGLRFAPQHAPGHFLFAIDSNKEIKAIKEDRIAKTLQSAAGDEFPSDPDKAGIYTIFLRNMTVYLSGSYSPGIFRNKWLRYAVLDEIEVKSELAEEGNTLDLAESRLKTDAGDSKLFAMSKPKKPGTAFHKRWCGGTRSVRLVPCPHCGTFQELSFFGYSATDNLKLDAKPGDPPPHWPKGQRLGSVKFDHCKHPDEGWDKDRLRTETFYECVCGCQIREHDVLAPAALRDPIIAGSLSAEVRALLEAGETVTHKRAMLLSGRWLGTNPKPHPKRRSRHISDLYSLYDDLSWGELAVMWIDAQGDAEKLLHFFNNNLGFVFRPKISTIDDKLVLELRHSGYRRGQCPFYPDLVTLNFDTQQYHYAAIVVAFLVDGTAAIIDWFDAISDDDIIRRFATPIEILAQPIHPQRDIPALAVGEPLHRVLPQYGLGDAAGCKGRTDDVYELCLKLPGKLYASFGRGGLQITTPIAERKTQFRMRDLPIYLFSDDTYKKKLYVDRIGRIKEIKAAQSEGKDPVKFGLPPRLYAPADMDSKLTTELSNERQREDGSWEDPAPGPNHTGDALKNALVQFDQLLPRLVASKQKAAEELPRSGAGAALPLTLPRQ